MNGKKPYWLLLVLLTFILIESRTSNALDLDVAPPIKQAPAVTLCNGKAGLNDFNFDWFCSALAKSHEPLIPTADLNSTKQAFRLIWLRSFHPGIVIRVEIRSSKSAVLVASQMRPNHGEGGDVTLQKSVNLEPKDISALESLLNEKDFWDQPHEFHEDLGFGALSSPIPKSQQIMMADGAVWILEGIAADRYQVMGDVVDSPPLRLGKVMLAMAHNRIPALAIDPVY